MGWDVIRPNDRWFREHFGEIWDNGFVFFLYNYHYYHYLDENVTLDFKVANCFSKNIESPARSVRRKWKCALVWANGNMTPSTQRKAGVAWAQPSRLAPMWLVRVRDSQWRPRSLILEVIWKISKAKILWILFFGLVMWWWNIGKHMAKWGNTRFGFNVNDLFCWPEPKPHWEGFTVSMVSSLMYAHLRWSLRGRQELNDTLAHSNF